MVDSDLFSDRIVLKFGTRQGEHNTLSEYTDKISTGAPGIELE